MGATAASEQRDRETSVAPSAIDVPAAADEKRLKGILNVFSRDVGCCKFHARFCGRSTTYYAAHVVMLRATADRSRSRSVAASSVRSFTTDERDRTKRVGLWTTAQRECKSRLDQFVK